MIIGVPKETKTDEYRIGLLAVGADLLTRDGHTVLIEAEVIGPRNRKKLRVDISAGRRARTSQPKESSGSQRD